MPKTRSKNDILASLEKAVLDAGNPKEIDHTWMVLMLEIAVDIRDCITELDLTLAEIRGE